MRSRGLLRLLFAALVALPAALFAAEEQSLLTPAGTLHTVRSGRAVDLGIDDPAIAPEDVVIEWAARAQDGATSIALIPGTDTRYAKRGLQLAYDEPTGALLLLWTEDISAMSEVRVGVLREGTWINSGLLPSQGISRAFNPQMLVTHQSVRYIDEQDQEVSKISSILSIIWWEEAQYGQARYASLFLDEEEFDPSRLAIYDLPVLIGGGGEAVYDGIPSGAYLFPSLQADGLAGAVLASFADLHESQHRVVRITFPEHQGKPSDPGDLRWQRRHIPIYGVTSSGPVLQLVPHVPAQSAMTIGTSIGAGYRPTVYWRDGDFLKYTRLEGADWSPTRSIALDESMSYDRALALVVGMGGRN